MSDAQRELLERFRWFVETGDMKPWAGPGATVDSVREAMRGDCETLLALAEQGAAIEGAKAAAFIEGATAQAGDDAIELQRARLAGVRIGLDAARREAATIRVALSGEQVAERLDMLLRIRALRPESIAGAE